MDEKLVNFGKVLLAIQKGSKETKVFPEAISLFVEMLPSPPSRAGGEGRVFNLYIYRQRNPI
jgi:hypothetical protein